MNKILIPESNSYLLKKYHLSSKLLIPMLSASIASRYFDKSNKSTKIFDSLNVVNFGFHSYVSTSAIITDYIKPRNISYLFRFSNLGLHGLAIGGFIYTIMDNNLKK